MKSINDILIIGGGVIGLTTAFRLAQQNVSVTLIDRQQVGLEASWAGAGMLPPGNLANATTPEARLRSYSHLHWDELSDTLKELTGIDNGYRRCGAIEVYAPAEQDAFNVQVSDWQAEGTVVEDLNRDDLESFVPGLDEQFQTGVRLPNFGQVRNPRHLKALAAACQNMGVHIVENAEFLRLTVSATQPARVVASMPNRVFHADRICLAAGSWTTGLLETIDVELPVKPVRGQMVQLKAEKLPFTHVIEQGRKYLVTRADGLILVGSTEEHVGFEKKNTSEGVAGLLKFAESIVPKLRNAEVVRCWAGLRPGSPDELPFLGQIPQFENLFVAAGHFRSGLQMSAGSARVIADLMLNSTPEIDLAGLTFDRILRSGTQL